MSCKHCLLLLSLLHSSLVSAKEHAHNPYRQNFELLLQEPSSGPYTKDDAAPVQELWLQQKVDHFDQLNNETWKMRYLRNAKYHKPQGPLFVFLGGEWTISPGLLSTGLVHDMAVENAGILFYTEHRYYGQSWPYGNDSFSLKQLTHLSLQQALADVAHFILFQKSESANLTHSKVILVGGSYSGSMAAWMTHLYPELVTASWASSAPLMAKADFHEYMEMVEYSINLTYGHNCTNRINRGLQYLVQLFDGNQTSELMGRLNACPTYNPNDSLDRITFFSGIGNYFALIVQSYSAYIPTLCETLMSLHSSDEEALQSFLELLYADDKQGKGKGCQNFGYKSMLQIFSESSDLSSGTRAWFYQTCSQFGWYTTTTAAGINTSSINFTSSEARFGGAVPLWYFEQLCRDAFGPTQTPAALAMGIAQMNAEFGGLAFDHSLRYREVLFTHGGLDPWRALGRKDGSQALVIPGYSHVDDLTSINVRDSVSMSLAKLRVMSFLRRHIIE